MATSRLRVVELAQGVAGPALGRLFAGWGHDVVKLEPRAGDWLRAVPVSSVPDSPVGLTFEVLNEAKRSAFGHPDDDEPADLLESLLDVADVAVVDLLPGRAAAAGLSPERVRERWPHLVWVSVTGFGLNGERPELEGDSLLAEAYGGLAHLIGRSDAPPLQLGGEQIAHAAAYAGLLGAELALLRRRQSGQGDVVDVALADVAAYVDWKSAVLNATEGIVNRRPRGSGLWQILPAADGWLGVVFNGPQWHLLVQLVDDDRLRDPALADQSVRAARAQEWMPVLREWVAARPAVQGYHQAQALGLPFGRAITVAELDDDPQLQARGFVAPDLPSVGAPWQLAGRPWVTGRPPAVGEHDAAVRAEAAAAAVPVGSGTGGTGSGVVTAPLDGIVVIDLGAATAGPGVGRLLVDYGATVYKVEAPGRPDSFRTWARPDGRPSVSTHTVPPLFEGNNSGKRGVALDLKDPGDRRRLLELAATADVVVENFRVGVPARLGIDLPDLLAVNPRLIVLSLASQGQHGPEARFASYGSTLDLLSGLASVTGYPGGPPTWSSYEVNYPDQVAVLAGAALVVCCLERGLTGLRIDLSQRELVAATLADRILEHRRTGRVAGPEGNRRGHAVPHDVYPAADDDRWVAVSCRTDEHRSSLAGVVPGLPADVDRRTWQRQWDEVDAAVGAWLRCRDQRSAVEALVAAGVPAVPCLDAVGRAQERGFAARRVFVDSANGHLGKGFPFVLRGWAPPVAARAPLLGEHGRTVPA